MKLDFYDNHEAGILHANGSYARKCKIQLCNHHFVSTATHSTYKAFFKHTLSKFFPEFLRSHQSSTTQQTASVLYKGHCVFFRH